MNNYTPNQFITQPTYLPLLSTHKITLNCLKIFVTILKFVKKFMRKSARFMPAKFYPILTLVYVTTVTFLHHRWSLPIP